MPPKGIWFEAIDAVQRGRVVFLPVDNRRAWTIFANARKKGLKITIRQVQRNGVEGNVVWRKS